MKMLRKQVIIVYLFSLLSCNGDVYNGALNTPKTLLYALLASVNIPQQVPPSTDMIPPTIVSKSPEGGATGIDLMLTVEVVFSKPMNKATVTADSFKLLKGTTQVDSTLSVSDTVMKLTPNSNLIHNEQYTVLLTTDIKDANGPALSSQYSWSFTVRDWRKVIISEDSFNRADSFSHLDGWENIWQINRHYVNNSDYDGFDHQVKNNTGYFKSASGDISRDSVIGYYDKTNSDYSGDIECEVKVYFGIQGNTNLRISSFCFGFGGTSNNVYTSGVSISAYSFRAQADNFEDVYIAARTGGQNGTLQKTVNIGTGLNKGWRTFKVKRIGNIVYAKIWSGTTEPTNWQFDYDYTIDSYTLPGSTIGFLGGTFTYGGYDATELWVDDLKLYRFE